MSATTGPDSPSAGDGAGHREALLGIYGEAVVDVFAYFHRRCRNRPVAEVARPIDRTLHATEALLVRARRAFRIRYEEVTR